MRRYPIKLGKEPLVEAVFEVRFDSTLDASVLLPGLLYSSLGVSGNPTRLVPAEVPDDLLRGLNPNFVFQPKVRLDWDGYGLLIAERAVAVTCSSRYPGWAKFKSAIQKVISVLKSAPQIASVHRYSMRYIDLLSGPDLIAEIGKLNMTLLVAGRSVGSKGFSVRFERDDIKAVHTIQLAAPAAVPSSTGAPKVGVIVDVDSSVTLDSQPVDEWVAALDSSLDELHRINKQTFFDCLTDAGIESLEPKYE